MHDVLAELGVPRPILCMVQVLYTQVRCELVVGVRRHPGFALTAGIRQGCPLSPLLFAVVGDIWLRRMRRILPSATIRAYADDIAIVMPQLLDGLRRLQKIFLE